MIEASNVSVRIGARRIVEDVAFEAMAGRLTAIVGPNGSGKTTFLKALSGELPYGGSIVLNGRQVSATKPGEAADIRPAGRRCSGQASAAERRGP